MDTQKPKRRGPGRGWWIVAVLFGLWTVAAWGESFGDHQAYLQCQAHPGPSIVFCVDGGVVDRLIWAASAVLLGLVVVARLLVATVRSVDDAVETHSR